MLDVDLVFGRKDAAEFLQPYLGRRVRPQMLERLASEGGGPRYVIRFGRACYTVKDLVDWVRQVTAEPRHRRVVPFRQPDPDRPRAA